MIDQIPREISVASLGRAQVIRTSLGTSQSIICRPDSSALGQETERGSVATPEKALFDLALRERGPFGQASQGPELELPADFDRKAIDWWIERIESGRLATMTRLGIDQMLARANSISVPIWHRRPSGTRPPAYE